MYCHICGKELPNEVKGCPDCGTAVPETRENRTHSSKLVEKPKAAAPKPIPAFVQIKEEPRTPSPSDYPMKWYYFLIYGFLIPSAVGLFISGLVYLFTGYVGLGLITICLGIDALIARSALANYKTSGPGQLVVFLISNYITGVVGNIMHYRDLSRWEAEGFMGAMYITTIIFSIIIGLIMIISNSVYFSNRKELFTE